MSDFERITSPWDDLFFRYVSSSKESIRIASPFIKSDITKQLLDTKLPKVSLKYVNSFKLQYFYSGASDLGALEAIIQEGGTIRNLQNLHAKLYVFDGSLAIVTSANF